MRALSIDPRMQRLGFDLRGIPGLEAAWLSRFPYGLGTMALPADNTPMGTWADLSGKGRDLTQATGANQPLWKANGGIPGMQFDGVNDFLRAASDTHLSDGITTYVVAAPLDTSPKISTMLDGIEVVRRTVTYIQSDTGTLVRAGCSRGGSVAITNTVPTASVHYGIPSVFTMVASDSATRLWLSGTLGDNALSGTPLDRDLTGFTLGSRYSSNENFFLGLIHDILICSQAHDDTTRQRVEAALARANGVTLAA